MKKYEYKYLNLKSYTASELINKLNKLGGEGWLLTASSKSDIKGHTFVILAREIKTALPSEVEELQKQLTKAREEGRREGVEGFVYYLFPIEIYHSSDVKDEFWWSRGDASIEAEKYLKSLKDKK